MIAVDTNVLVRFLVGDDPGQLKASTKLIANEQVFVPDTVLVETEWVLRDAYELDAETVNGALRALCSLPNVTLGNAHMVALTLDWHAQGLDFADAFHLAASQGQEALKTFDRGFVSRAKGLGQCRVEKP